MRLVCIADLHNKLSDRVIPDGNVLIVAGDLSQKGTLDEIKRFDGWLARFPHPHKIVIAGNHDWALAKADKPKEMIKNGRYLLDSGLVIDGFKFWGSPWQPRYFDGAFDLARGPALAEVWRKIPHDIDVLITHTPPFCILDRTRRGKHVGCKALAEAVQRVKPKVHVFGHVHESSGMTRINDTVFINAAQAFKKRALPINSGIIDLEQNQRLIYQLTQGEKV